MPWVLTYHSHNVGGNFSPTDDHGLLVEDLHALTRKGRAVVPLSRLVDWLNNGAPDDEMNHAVCLTFDDGCDLDVRDFDFPEVGHRQGFHGILRDFRDHHGVAAQPELHATTFVIASENARQAIDQRSLFGRGWMSHDWWAMAEADPLLSIGNHGWDHNHPDVDPGDPDRGGFSGIAGFGACEQQVVKSAEYIRSKIGTWPDLFAYPFGESSTYLRETFFPENQKQHCCRAAFGAHPGEVTARSDRWNLPRLVAGRDWNSSSELLKLLA